jgi:exosortase
MLPDRSFDRPRVAGPRMNTGSKAWLHSAAVGIVLIAYLPFFKTLLSASATNPYAGHVIFVPILAAVLLWVERHRLRGSAGPRDARGAAVTALALALATSAYTTGNVPLQALSFVAAMAGLGFWFYGVRGVRAGAFVLVFLLFMVPPPRGVVSAIAPDVQHFVAAFSSVVLGALRIPVEQQGVFLRLPGLTLEVAEECAGLRFLLILFVLVLAFARVALPTIPGQLALIVLCVPIAVLANATRVAVTSIGAYAIGPEAVTGPLHYYIGKSFWALALLAMIGFAGLLRSRTEGVVAGGRPRPAPCVADTP